jgi:hypothetical protein
MLIYKAVIDDTETELEDENDYHLSARLEILPTGDNRKVLIMNTLYQNFIPLMLLVVADSDIHLNLLHKLYKNSSQT